MVPWRVLILVSNTKRGQYAQATAKTRMGEWGGSGEACLRGCGKGKGGGNTTQQQKKMHL